MPTSRPAAFRFDILMTGALSLTVGAFFSDLWAHSHGRVESFFTIWHLALYGAAGAVFLVLAMTWARSRRTGSPWRTALPGGYGLSLVGAILFIIGGGLDLLWHRAFGIEANVSALFSPTHILLFGAGVLMTSGPLRAAWRRGDGPSTPWVVRLPMVISIALVLSVLTAMSQFINPLVDPFAERASGPDTVFSELYTMNADGSRQTRLVATDRVHVFGPVWSPDGTRIAFAKGTDAAFGVGVANADGSGSRALMPATTGSSFPGSWSPDGSRLLVVSQAGEAGSRIESVVVASGQRSPVSGGSSHDGRPMFSPDGARILFNSDRDGRYQVYVMKADGTETTQLTRGAGESWGASWSPDGQRIAFNSDRGGRHEIYLMNGDGRGQHSSLTCQPGRTGNPCGRPTARGSRSRRPATANKRSTR